MAVGEVGRGLSAELNRLANGGTYPAPSAFKGDNAAASTWAGLSSPVDVVDALNHKAGRTDPSTYKGLNAVANELAGTTGLEIIEALRSISA
jgi:hypothetical protein